MLKKLVFFLLLFSSFCFSQEKNIYGKWITEKITYSDGKELEINHPLYSYGQVYYLTSNQMFINNMKIKIQINDSEITGQGMRLSYKKENNYLILTELNSGLKYYCIKDKEFIKKYPEFLQESELLNDEKYYVSNKVTEPVLYNNEVITNDFLMYLKNKYDGKKIEFSLNIFINKENKIQKISISDSNLEQKKQDYILAFFNNKKLYFNNTIQENVVNKIRLMYTFKELDLSREKIKQSNMLHELFMNNKFEEFIEYNNTLRQNNYFLENEYNNIRLGVAYLATKQVEKACEIFTKTGNITNFSVRNYLKNFCQKN